jgi:hypothetical protein
MDLFLSGELRRGLEFWRKMPVGAANGSIKGAIKHRRGMWKCEFPKSMRACRMLAPIPNEPPQSVPRPNGPPPA